MKNIDKIKEHISRKKNEVFNVTTWWPQIIENFKNICFLGEVNKEIFYVTMLHQVKLKETGELLNLTEDQQNEFYLTGTISDIGEYEEFSWTFWRINLETSYLSVFVSFNGNKNVSPKANYGLSYENIQKLDTDKLLNLETSFDSLFPEDKEVFDTLVEIINYSKSNHITIADFHKKVHTNFSEYFGLLHNKNFIKDEFLHTSPPEEILIPQPFSLVHIFQDTRLIKAMRGTSFEELSWDPPNAVVRTFDSAKDLTDFMYSCIRYINSNNEIFNISQQISKIHKLWESNKWPMLKEGSQQSENLKKYEFRITKTRDKFYFKAYVAEYGLCYYFTNTISEHI